MNKLLEKQNYIVLPNFISEQKAQKLGEEYKNYCIVNNISNDEQAVNSHSSYNYISFLELLCEKTPEISNILEETVLPTYCYSRVYKKGSILERHEDRDACEISLTLNLNGDKPWPIWIETPDGKEKFISLNPGDAMIYLGTVAEHWREEYTGEYYTQVFLHYVRSRGNCSYAYFDKERNKSSEEETIEETIEEKLQESVNYNISPETTIEHFVKVFDDIISEELCDQIVDTFKNYDLPLAETVGNGLNLNIRNCYAFNNFTRLAEIDENTKKYFDEELYKGMAKVIKEYTKLYPTLDISIDTGYNLLMYKEGQYYTQHVDNYVNEQRSLSCSIQLNDDYEGGEFALFDKKMLIRAKKGSAIVFPSNFMFPHEILPVQKGTRYSIITWCV